MKQITKIRKGLGWSESKVSHVSGVHLSSISAIECGRLNPWPGQLRRLADALGWEGDPAALLEEVPDGARD